MDNAIPLEWGTSENLSPLETLMWRADSDRAMRSAMMAVEILDTEPDWNRLTDAHEWASRMVPRLCDRVAEPLGFMGTPIWVTVGSMNWPDAAMAWLTRGDVIVPGRPAPRLVTADSETWLGFIAKERSLLWALLRRKIRIKGSPKLLIAFGKCFPS